MGAAVIFVITIASFITSVLDKFILQQFDITYLRTIVFIFSYCCIGSVRRDVYEEINAAIVQRTWYFLTTDHNKLCRSWCCPEQCTVWLWYWRKYNQWFRNSSWIYHSIVIMAGIREKIEYNDIPTPFKGSAIVLVTAGLMSIAFMGFSGVI